MIVIESVKQTNKQQQQRHVSCVLFWMQKSKQWDKFPFWAMVNDTDVQMDKSGYLEVNSQSYK